MKNGDQTFTISNSIHFLNVAHQTKTLHNFHEIGQHLIARHIKDLGWGLRSGVNVESKGMGAICQKKGKEMLKKGKTLENLEENVLNLKLC